MGGTETSRIRELEIKRWEPMGIESVWPSPCNLWSSSVLSTRKSLKSTKVQTRSLSTTLADNRPTTHGRIDKEGTYKYKYNKYKLININIYKEFRV